jgi:hypothetical protein
VSTVRGLLHGVLISFALWCALLGVALLIVFSVAELAGAVIR